MLDQRDPAQVSRPAPLSFSAVSSYAIGPLDPSQLTSLHASLADGQEITLLLPVHLPASVLNHPTFKESYDWGYTENLYTSEWSVPGLLNDLYAQAAELFEGAEDAESYPWTVGFLLGDLSHLAETDRVLALVGIAHVCFLLSLTETPPADWPERTAMHAHIWHNSALKAYRGRVRCLREQGKSFTEAQRLALAPCVLICGSLPEAASPCPTRLLAALLEHPEFVQGACAAHDFYFDRFEEAPLTEAEMVREVEEELSQRAQEQEARLACLPGLEPPSYLYRLGWVVGTIAQGLSYVHE